VLEELERLSGEARKACNSLSHQEGPHLLSVKELAEGMRGEFKFLEADEDVWHVAAERVLEIINAKREQR